MSERERSSRVRRWTAIFVGVALGCTACAWQARAESDASVTPRGAMREFLEACRAGDYESAARRLDLRGRASAGAEVARRVKFVLDRKLWVDLDALSDEPDGAGDDGLPRGQDLVGTIAAGDRDVPVIVSRHVAADGRREWKIAASTLDAVPELYAAVGGSWIRERAPESLTRIRALELELWQWLGLLALALGAASASLAVAACALALARRRWRRPEARAGDFEAVARGPLRAFVAVLVFAAGRSALALPVPAESLLRSGERVLLLVIATWLLTRAVDAAARRVSQRMAAEGRIGAVSVVSLGSRLARISLWALATVALVQNIGFDVTALFAGIGLGGLAIALAAQKTVENLFGGLTLLVDQPVRVGDFCRFGDRLGTVEEVGLRSTRVRTLDRTLVTVPNGEFASLQLENYTRRDRIWLRATLGLRYETTPDQLRCVLEDLRRLLRLDARVDPDPARVRFVGFGAYSLDLEVFAYVRTADYGEFLAIQEDLYLAMMDVVAAAGTSFAFPSQTIYGASDPGLDAEKTRAAEARARQPRAGTS
jgi:MscS family membrane protein